MLSYVHHICSESLAHYSRHSLLPGCSEGPCSFLELLEGLHIKEEVLLCASILRGNTADSSISISISISNKQQQEEQ
jgi:hypothetical protein